MSPRKDKPKKGKPARAQAKQVKSAKPTKTARAASTKPAVGEKGGALRAKAISPMPQPQSQGASERRRLIIFSSTSGVRMDACLQRFMEQAPREYRGGLVHHCLEDHHVEAGRAVLERMLPTPAEDYTLVDVLGLPFSELVSVCSGAWDRLFAHLRTEPERFLLASFHPVLYHQQTHEFAHPYDAQEIAKGMGDSFSLTRVVSIHDDIYDVYRELLGSRELFDPRAQGRTWRDPLRDILDLRLLLDWRDRELAEAKALAAALGVRHFLFHRKGRLDTLFDVLLAEKPCVYFSHPISQPRRDITGKPHPKKCKVPDAARGRAFIADCQGFADQLAGDAAIVEPTAIDELRLGSLPTDWVQKSKDHILPPLTPRWPIGTGERLGGSPAELNREKDNSLLSVPIGVFGELQIDPAQEAELPAKIQGALAALEAEIRRQIKVRDYALAEQADLCVAFRPFSEPDSPDEAGGVAEEIRVMDRKARLGRLSARPAIVVLHPQSDETRRRGNEFDLAWQKIADEFLAGTPSGTLDSLRLVHKGIIVNLNDEMKEEKLIEACKGHSLGAQGREGSLAPGALSNLTATDRAFCKRLVEDTDLLMPGIKKLNMGAESILRFIEANDYNRTVRSEVQQLIQSSSTQSRH